MKRTIAILALDKGVAGTSLYVQTLLNGIDPDTFRVLLVAFHQHQFRLPDHVTLCPLDAPDTKVLNKSTSSKKSGLLAGIANVGRQLWRMAPLSWRFALGARKDARVLENQVRSALREHDYDLLHTQVTGLTDVQTKAACAASKKPVVSTLHITSTSSKRSKVLVNPYDSLRSTAKLIAVSEFTKRDWHENYQVPLEKVRVIHNGLDMATNRRRLSAESARSRLGLPMNGLLVGCVGRLNSHKGFDYAIEAFVKVVQEFPDAKLVVAGEGDEFKNLQRLAVELGVSESVLLVGHQKSMSEYYDSFDIVLIPSLSEAFGFVAIEAMFRELPVVATAVGGLKEVVVCGSTGFLVEPKNTEEMAAAICRLGASVELRSKLGVAGKSHAAANFDQQKMVRNTERLYLECISDG